MIEVPSEGEAVLLTRDVYREWCPHELWLHPDGLLLVQPTFRRGLTQVMQRMDGGGYRYRPRTADTRPMDGALIRRELHAKRTNVWIPRSQIASARVRRGLLRLGVDIHLTDGRRFRLRWLKDDPWLRSGETLEAWRRWLGERPAD